MAYRRKQSVTRSATFVEDHRSFASPDDSSSSLAAQAIRASAAHRDSSLSSAYAESAFAASADSNRPKGSQDSNMYEYTSMKSLNESKHGFWDVLAKKAKAIIEDDTASHKFDNYGTEQPEMFDPSTGSQSQSRWSFENYRKPEKLAFQKRTEAIASSVDYVGGRIRNALEDGRTIVANKTADIIQETKKLQIRRKTSNSNLQNQATEAFGPANLSHNQTEHDTQLKASRDVANAMAAKAKLLLRELKTVKADLTFAKERCAQLEEENKILRENRHKGGHSEDEDLIRLQLESLLSEKARLAHENSMYARENRFLREIVEFHQLTMQNVVYLDEDAEEVTEVDPNEILPFSPSHSVHEVGSPASPRSPTANPDMLSSPDPSVVPGSPSNLKLPHQDVLNTQAAESESSPPLAPTAQSPREQ
ncbi:uncharacterized protein [Typha latifolia]|uniref:uncharacterized protein n=1 Tax=Typha latifolia TaxID=4733 RepID=UPI003C2CCEC5